MAVIVGLMGRGIAKDPCLSQNQPDVHQHVHGDHQHPCDPDHDRNCPVEHHHACGCVVHVMPLLPEFQGAWKTFGNGLFYALPGEQWQQLPEHPVAELDKPPRA